MHKHYAVVAHSFGHLHKIKGVYPSKEIAEMACQAYQRAWTIVEERLKVLDEYCLEFILSIPHTPTATEYMKAMEAKFQELKYPGNFSDYPLGTSFIYTVEPCPMAVMENMENYIEKA